jgi:hypothetical protein
MSKTSEESRLDAVRRAHEIVASQGGKFAGSPWTPKHDHPIGNAKGNAAIPKRDSGANKQ